MHKQVNGQKPLSAVQQHLEDEATRTNRPVGMPPLEVVQTEAKRMKLQAGDAETIYDYWLMTGFRTKVGRIRDWRACMRTWYRRSCYPSQKGQKPPGLLRAEKEKPAQLKEAAADRLESDQARARIQQIKKKLKGG
jgi:hypothetical protein